MRDRAAFLQIFNSLANDAELPLLVLDIDLERVRGEPGAAAGGGVRQLVETIFQSGRNADRDGSRVSHGCGLLYTH